MLRQFLAALLLTLVSLIGVTFSVEPQAATLPANTLRPASSSGSLSPISSHRVQANRLARLMLADAQQWADRGWLDEARNLASRAAQYQAGWSNGELTPEKFLAQLNAIQDQSQRNRPTDSMADRHSNAAGPRAMNTIKLTDEKTTQMVTPSLLPGSSDRTVLPTVALGSVTNEMLLESDELQGYSAAVDGAFGTKSINRDSILRGYPSVTLEVATMESPREGPKEGYRRYPMPSSLGHEKVFTHGVRVNHGSAAAPIHPVLPLPPTDRSLTGLPSLDFTLVAIAIAVGSFLAGSVFSLVGVVTSAMFLPHGWMKSGALTSESNLMSQQASTLSKREEFEKTFQAESESVSTTGVSTRSGVKQQTTEMDQQFALLPKLSSKPSTSLFTELLQSNLELQKSVAKTSWR